MYILPLSVYVRSRLQETPLNTFSAWGWTPERRMVRLVYGHFRRDLTSERCLLRWTRLVSRWSLPARMKKSSCIQLTTPKLVNLNTLSMIHITWTQIIMRTTLTSAEVVSVTLLQKPTLEEKIVMRSGTSAVDWNVKEISELFLDCVYSQYLVVGHHQKILLLELGGIIIQSLSHNNWKCNL